MKVLITGNKGQLGKALIEVSSNFFDKNEIDIIIPNRKELDLSNLENCRSFVKNIRPDWIINSGAYTCVDDAEDSCELAFLINSYAPRAFAEALLEFGGNFLQVSTDYVFDGNLSKAYQIKDKRCPINVYGKTKLLAEKYIESLLIPNHQGTIVRTSWLVGPEGNNFVLKVLSLQEKSDLIRIVDDQISSPTSTRYLAKTCWKIIKKKSDGIKLPSIFHCSNSGIASWYDLAEAVTQISLEMGLISNASRIIPIKSHQFITKAKRPSFSVLDCSESFLALSQTPIHWRTELEKLLLDKSRRMTEG
tara:strand:+ start:1513 stop:2427 length:915 start_codon:yes stop_codon:yes gene_type:complete